MKKIIFSILLGLPFIMYAQPNLSKATINGTLRNVKGKPQTLNYVYMAADSTVKGTTIIKNNKYKIQVKGEMPLRVLLSITDPAKSKSKKNKIQATVFVEKGNNTVLSVDSFSNITVKESKAHAEYVKLNNQLKPYYEEMEALRKPYSDLREKKDTAGMRKIRENSDALDEKMLEEVFGNYVRENPGSPMALYALSQYAGFDMEHPEKVRPLFNALPVSAKTSAIGERFAKRLAFAEITAVGSLAPVFSQADTSGNMVSLESFKGKFVLVDFWAS